MRHTVELRDAQTGWRAFNDLWPLIKAHLMAGRRLILSIRTDTRSLASNRLMWSCLGDLASQVEWDGQRFDADGWKVLITATIHGQREVRTLVFAVDGEAAGTSTGAAGSNMRFKAATSRVASL